MDQCDFCNLEEFSSQIVYEDDGCIVIYPRKPIVLHHFIIFPKNHAKLVSDMGENEVVLIHKAIKKIFNQFRIKSGCGGYNIVSNNGDKKFGQTVAHSHFHIYLRFDDEKISPYKVMSDMNLRETLTIEEWSSRKRELEKIINA